MLSSYRPIYLLAVFNRILEKLVDNKQSRKVFGEINYYFCKQFGFRSKDSTSHALLLLTDKIQKAIDLGTHACGILLGLCKAFDTLDHKILLAKLECYGIHGIAYD